MSNKPSRKSAVALLGAVLDRPVEVIPEDASIFNFPAWDSLAHTKMMLLIEDESGSMLEPSTITSLTSLKAIDEYLDVIAANAR